MMMLSMRSSAENWRRGHTWKEKSGQILLVQNRKLDNMFNFLQCAFSNVQTSFNAAHKSPANAIRSTHSSVYCTPTLSNAFIKSMLCNLILTKRNMLGQTCVALHGKTLETLEIGLSFHSHCILSRSSHAHLQRRNATFSSKFQPFSAPVSIFCVKRFCTPIFCCLRSCSMSEKMASLLEKLEKASVKHLEQKWFRML